MICFKFYGFVMKMENNHEEQEEMVDINYI